MICALGTGWLRSSRASTASAGGQLEQPSDVKSSTITGDRSPARASKEVMEKTSANPNDDRIMNSNTLRTHDRLRSTSSLTSLSVHHPPPLRLHLAPVRRAAIPWTDA